jgi:predicted nucleic acid-binding protein
MTLRFLDTNILLYTISVDPAEAAKRQTAIRWITPMDWVISAQVLQEFYANAVRKRTGGISVEAADVLLKQFIPRVKVAIDASLVAQAAQISQRHQLSYWDGAIVAAAMRSGAKELLTEDLNAGQVIEGVRVVNPFAA